MKQNILYYFFLIFLSLSGCTAVDPRHVNLEIPSGSPEIKNTELSNVLRDLGKMAEIYGEEAEIMLDKISDNTGTSIHTKAEIPYDVTEMTASALNSIGGNVAFIPYRPDIMLNLQNLGYQDFRSKVVPAVLVTGGITEFDRGLESKENSTNLGYETTQFGQESPVGLEYMQGEKNSIAKITIDYNMINLSSMSGLPGVQTSNTIQVHKGIKDKELGFTVFGPTLGLKGEIKKVEGRHAALRLLVQSSMIQIVGKYLDLPYWRLIPGIKSDPVVEHYVRRGWDYQMNRKKRIKKIQELLYLHGYDGVRITGEMDKRTKNELKNFIKKNKDQYHLSSDAVDFSLYSALYYNIPLDETALQRRIELVRMEHEEKIKTQKEAAANSVQTQ
jgi:hypothetical protein